MNPSLVRLKWVRRAFFLMAAIGIFSGAGVALFSSLVLRPRLSALVVSAEDLIASASRNTRLAQQSLRSASRVIASWNPGTQIASVLPATLRDTRGVLREAASALQASAHITRQAQKGVTGLVAPDKALQETNQALERTAFFLNRLDRSVGTLAVQTEGLAPWVEMIRSDVSHMATQLASANGPVEDALKQIEGLRKSIDHAALPAQGLVLGLGLALLLLLYGLIALFLGLALPSNRIAIGETQIIKEAA